MTPTPREVDSNRISEILEMLARKVDSSKSTACYIYIMGWQTKRTIKDAHRFGVEILICKSCFPNPFGFLSYLIPIPSAKGLIRVDKISLLKNVFNFVSENTMAGVIVIDKQKENDLKQLVQKMDLKLSTMNDVLKLDPEAVIYVYDTNNPSSKTEIYEFAF